MNLTIDNKDDDWRSKSKREGPTRHAHARATSADSIPPAFVVAHLTLCVWRIDGVMLAGKPKYWERIPAQPLIFVHSKHCIGASAGLTLGSALTNCT